MTTLPKPLEDLTEDEVTTQNLPCNMTFSFSKLNEGSYIVWLSGFTAGPPATINAPQLITSFYNPAAMFDGWSLGGQYGAHAMAFFGEDGEVPTLFFQGWITNIQNEGKFEHVSFKFPLK
ncbi:hypothetical protein [Roseibium sp. RKSG952]|uniref:hypothetical protein n=1 Tax=Roseibium sp. RKSG952 TaxID=2529384 RepID=UPI0012BB656E|nr:hypothetical protein [Roseibium sp. RKSG952]MTH96803.1 hypothetical protein [Roseibium sp. RKSG952]